MWGETNPLKEQQHAVQNCVARIVSSNLVIIENRFLCHSKNQYTELQWLVAAEPGSDNSDDNADDADAATLQLRILNFGVAEESGFSNN